MPLALQVALQVAGDVPDAGQHRDFLQRHLLVFRQLFDFVDDPLGLLRAFHENGPLGFHLATRPAADQGLGQGAFAGGVDRVDVAHHRRAAAVILVEHHRIRSGEVPGKVADVLHLGALEGVNGLGVVAHDGQKGVRGNQLPQNGDLNVIGVLILVDIDVGRLKLDEPADVLGTPAGRA